MQRTESVSQCVVVHYVPTSRVADADKLWADPELKALFAKYNFPIEAVIAQKSKRLQTTR